MLESFIQTSFKITYHIYIYRDIKNLSSSLITAIVRS